MRDDSKVVARYNDGQLLKGYIRDFTGDGDTVVVEEAATGKGRTVYLDELKALFYVKSFEGSQNHRDRKIYRAGQKKGRKVYIQFSDREKTMGFLEADVPPEKLTAFLKPDGKTKGFFLIPADQEGNNTRVFAVWRSVADITTAP